VIRLRPHHIRTRLTLWYVSLLVALLLLYGIGTSLLLFRNLHKELATHTVEDLETLEGLLFFDANGQLRLRDDYHNHPESKHVQERLLEVRSPQGEVLYRNERLGSRSLGDAPFAGEGEGTYSQRSVRLTDGTRVQLASRRHSIDGKPVLIRLGYTEDLVSQAFRELLLAQGAGLLLALGLAGLGGYALARRALAPLDKMARQAERITSERLHERLPAESVDDELGHLARVFNRTLGRLEQSFEQLRRFTSDASHELRTPLTLIRSVGEVGLQQSGSVEDYREIVGSMLEEASRLTRLLDSLLTISRADAGQIALQWTTIQVLDLVRETAALFEVLTEEKSLQLVLEGDALASVEADRVLLRQALVNILHNAIKYSPPGGVISIRVIDMIWDCIIEISDEGPGIPTEHHTRVFDRFYRVDEGRSRESGGAGLGLAIAKWTVEAHGGDLSLQTAESGGCTFRMLLHTQQETSGRPRKNEAAVEQTQNHDDFVALRTSVRGQS
jgi:heavy metal sensor kinase